MRTNIRNCGGKDNFMSGKIRRKAVEGVHGVARAVKWALIATVCGIACGLAGGLFVKGLQFVTGLRLRHPAFMLLLPIGGVLIFWYYHLLGDDQQKGTNIVITSIQSGEKIPSRLAPAVFVATIFSHLCGASVGREGAALQLGGSIGHIFSRAFRMDPKNGHIMVMSGMSGAFSAVFGTPVTAVFFSMEVTNVGLMNYAALLPCVIASFAGREAAKRWLGIEGAAYSLTGIPAAQLPHVMKIGLLAVCCGLISVLFCIVLRQTARLWRRILPNRYIRALVLGSILLLLTYLTGGRYNGTGAEAIKEVIELNASGAAQASKVLGAGASGANVLIPVFWYTWLMKILFTALSLAAGYKGGEIVPTFFIGATFGYFFGTLTGFAPSLCAAVGLGAMFCGVTNAPVTSIFLCIELFGAQGLVYYVIAIAVAYLASSYYGLYPAQKIVFSKYASGFINKGAD